MLMTRGAKLDLKDKVRTVMVRCMPTQKQHDCKRPGYHYTTCMMLCVVPILVSIEIRAFRFNTTYISQYLSE